MPDHAVSTSPEVQAQLDRLWSLSPGADVLGLERIAALCAALGNPERTLPPVFHVAGTNGKGSTCAFLRAMLEAAGHRVHVYTSPHLVRFNERIRIAGRLIDDAALAPLLAEVLDAAEAAGISASFFEVTTAAAFLAFSRARADACVIEVGLGGRLDATNVIPAPVCCGIASLGIDHEAFLLAPEAGTPAEPLARIAFEKAGIAKTGVPLVTQRYPPVAMAAIEAVARAVGADWIVSGRQWAGWADGERLSFRGGDIVDGFPLPALAGGHQVENAALAIAMLRYQALVPSFRPTVPVDRDAIIAGLRTAHWPARLQRLRRGPLTTLAGHRTVWLDGGHNMDAGERIAAAFDDHAGPLDLVIGMLANKDPAAIVGPLASLLGARLTSIRVVPVPGHDWHPARAFRRVALPLTPRDWPNLAEAVAATTNPVLIAGSLYLAGEALRLNDEMPN